MFYTRSIQYNWKVSFDKLMINADIKLFLMRLGHKTFDDLNDNALCEYFEYAGTLGYKVPVWGEVQKQAYND